jgi:type IV pilus assembly protein PilM
MLPFVQSWFNPVSSPIGIDFGTDCVRMAQVEMIDNEPQLVAAGSADVPTHVRNDPGARFSFFYDTVRDLLSQGNFRGRRVVLSLPASLMHIQHLRLPKMDDEALKKTLVWEARGKLPFDPAQAVLRHMIAGEVYHDQEPKYEVILMAARRDLVEQLLAAAAKARLDVVGMNVEPKALVDCFAHVFRRPSDRDVATCFVDIGSAATRAVITRAGRIQFARAVPIGGEHFSRAVATSLRIPLEESRQLRIKVAAAGAADETRDKSLVLSTGRPQASSPAPESDPMDGTGFALLSAGIAAAERREPTGQPVAAPAVASTPRIIEQLAQEPRTANGEVSPLDRRQVDEACAEPLTRLVAELALCRRYYEGAFPDQPVQRLIFVGGEANQRSLCQHIARELGVAAQVGDPLVRMGKSSDVGIESGIDRRVPQPAWSIAIGLSMGPAAVEAGKAK